VREVPTPSELNAPHSPLLLAVVGRHFPSELLLSLLSLSTYVSLSLFRVSVSVCLCLCVCVPGGERPTLGDGAESLLGLPSFVRSSIDCYRIVL